MANQKTKRTKKISGWGAGNEKNFTGFTYFRSDAVKIISYLSTNQGKL